ncbi:GxxExxY protein [Haliovirga abyssi]|uniref:GxxExxY protein n=1 Tax=Haliovirga abyssi TaxID=2996794 RepID=A0AAU9D9V4_9FUSO|nr:GxxExxY protein [Haliovirga abyssi]BDU51423.1 hypothetical protein HLVA_19920 [Haliovirga abyssi]
MEGIVYKDSSYKIIGIAMEVHNELGNGFLEKVYENAMMVLFHEKRIYAEQQKNIKVIFHGKEIGSYIADILVGNKIILELKTVEKIKDIHRAQLFNLLGKYKFV